VGVITLNRRVWFYQESGINVIERWLREIRATESDRSQLRAFLALYEFSGERAIASAADDIGDGLHILVSSRRGGPTLAPIFHYGPFSDLEITFLEGAVLDDKTLRPYSAKGTALERLERLREDPRRRRHERIGKETST
jgi:hypothetical protein